MSKTLKSSFLPTGILILVGCVNALGAPAWSEFSRKSNDWYHSEEGLRVAANILSWQSPHGSWPKNGNTTAQPYLGEPQRISGTFDSVAAQYAKWKPQWPEQAGQ